MPLSALLRERLKLLAGVAAVGAAIGCVYGVVLSATASQPQGAADRLASALSGALTGLVISASIGAIEILLLRAGPLRGVNALPFLVVVISKCLIYAVIVLVAVAIGPDALPFGDGTATSTRTPRTLAITVGFSLGVTFLFVMILQAATLLGRRTFRDLVFGRYRRPRAERRFFLFADVVGSSALAERLGPLDAHRFLSIVFSAVAEPVAEARGEIYQYVGDEIVVTWTEAEGAVQARPVRCLFEMRAALAARAERFRARFDAVPALRAALHFGEVIAGEVGDQRRAIVFHGDVMNTTARLEQATRDVGLRFIVSQAALEALGPLPAIELSEIGALALRGRAAPVHAYGIVSFEGVAAD
ncbi:MAG: adenylate/guanylate cyclase domain-containing protein [Burkholderiales bacterium]|nr:adenylate/guanylate cyclase domain-containing protein [Burkholderiales bacterium]